MLEDLKGAMISRVKVTNYKYKANEIEVRDHFGFFTGREEFFVNGELVSYHESRLFKHEKYNNVLADQEIVGLNGEIFHIRVICGMHLNLFRRVHIFVNSRLEGGDIDKQIYTPPRPWCCIFALFAMIGFFSLFFLFLPETYQRISLENEIRDKIETNSPDLWQKEINRYFFKDHKDLKSMKKAEWATKCEENSDYHCRLVSYIYSVNGDEVSGLKSAIRGCLNNNYLSCNQAFLSKLFNVDHPSYEKASSVIANYCLKNTTHNERDKKVCYGFSRYRFRETGDMSLNKEIMKKLCNQGYKYGCYMIDALEGRVTNF